MNMYEKSVSFTCLLTESSKFDAMLIPERKRAAKRIER